MARPLRLEFSGALYHVTARGNWRGAIFEDDTGCQRFLELLAQSLGRYEATVHGFVLMSNHFHLLVQTRCANLSRWMHWLLAAYTIGFQHRHRRVGHGHLFQGRYKSIVVEAAGYLLALSRYLHLNPVRGRVLGRGEIAQRRERLRAWPWSSFGGYAGLRKPFEFVSDALVLGEMANWLPAGGNAAKLRQGYRRYVEQGLHEAQANPLEEAMAGTVLGSESFVQKVRDHLAASQRTGSDRLRRQQRESPAFMSVLPGREEQMAEAKAALILGLVAAHYGIRAETILDPKAGYRLEARAVALVLVREKTSWSHRQIGQWCGGVDYAAVAQRIARIHARERTGISVPASLVALRAQCHNL